VLVVSQKFEEYARKVEQELRSAGLRATGDYRPEKIGSKIRDAQLELIPYMFVVGGKEMLSDSVAVRDRIAGDLGAMKVAEAIAKLKGEIAERAVRQKFETSVPPAGRGGAHEY
jgi:threonyl-tRNA synthetase